MKFYGNGIVWDSEKNKKLCSFVDGVFETQDEYIINKLKNRYEHEVELEEVEVEMKKLPKKR